jgi:glyoxalase family protein
MTTQAFDPHLSGFHHLTAMAGDARANIDFYTKVLGLRLVKVTVNFDDPGTYHLYYGDEVGSPGSIITFFPWGGDAKTPPSSTGLTGFTLRVPAGTLPAWEKRLQAAQVAFERVQRPEGEVLSLLDESNHRVQLWADGPPLAADKVVRRSPVPAAEQIVALAGVTMTVPGGDGTRQLLRTFGLASSDEKRFTFKNKTGFVEVLGTASTGHHRMTTASIHHVAFAVHDDADEAAWQAHLMAAGQAVTEVKDRQYFRSVYMREPGGIILELATLAPGFAVDEAPDSLGTRLCLPPGLESQRALIEQHLTPLPGITG